MFPATRQHAPLYSAWIPGWVRVALAAAGLPVVALESAAWLSQDRPADWPAALVLFDSRAPDSRATAEGVGRHGPAVLDVAPLASAARRTMQCDRGVSTGGERPGAFGEFLSRLKREVESLGFLWTRLADCPHPYRTFSPVTSPEVVEHPVPQEAAAHEADLVWRATATDVLRWRSYRRRVAVRIHSSEQALHIACELPGPEYRPSLEIWRGGHFACLPLQRKSLRVTETQLLFQIAGDRHPAGLIARTAFESVNDREPAPALAQVC